MLCSLYSCHTYTDWCPRPRQPEQREMPTHHRLVTLQKYQVSGTRNQKSVSPSGTCKGHWSSSQHNPRVLPSFYFFLQPRQEEFHQRVNVTLPLSKSSWCCHHHVQVSTCRWPSFHSGGCSRQRAAAPATTG